jgi:GT2 family glycosyltransferase
VHNKPSVDFVVCTWNNRDIISPTLHGIARQTVKDFTCTVVDDCSTDGTIELVQDRFPWVRVVRKEKNSGPSPSRNIGLARGQAEYVVFMDSDVTLAPDWAEQQIRLLESRPSTGIACGKLLYSPFPQILYGAYGTMSRYGVAWDGGSREPAESFQDVRRCLWANTTALMARRSMTDVMGGFDGAMFTMFEDTDFGWRANLFGYEVICNPAAVAVHQVHGTLNPTAMNRRLVYLVWRNRLRSILVNYEAFNILRYAVPFVVMSVADAAVHGPWREKFSALWWNVKMFRDTMQRRQFVQRSRTVPDRCLWPLFEKRLRGPGYFVFAAGTEPNERSAPADSAVSR